jgi:hypothetical protein
VAENDESIGFSSLVMRKIKRNSSLPAAVYFGSY